MTGYEYSRNWFNWTFENTEKINPNHTALYFYILERANYMGWKENFGLPMELAKEAIGIKNYRTYTKTFEDLISFGFIKLIEKSKNQYTSNVIALVKNTKAHTKAHTKAQQDHSQSIVGIIKPITIKPITINIEFCIFWDLYNKKIGDKTKCEKKWISLTDIERKKIIDTLPNFIKSISEKKYQPYPETYFNNKRWEDESSVIVQHKNGDTPLSSIDPREIMNARRIANGEDLSMNIFTGEKL